MQALNQEKSNFLSDIKIILVLCLGVFGILSTELGMMGKFLLFLKILV